MTLSTKPDARKALRELVDALESAQNADGTPDEKFSADRYTNALTAARAALSAPSEEGWIPVTERWPEGGDEAGNVLTYQPDCPECGPGSAQWTIQCVTANNTVGVQPVTHWMPLPAPPADAEKKEG